MPHESHANICKNLCANVVLSNGTTMFWLADSMSLLTNIMKCVSDIRCPCTPCRALRWHDLLFMKGDVDLTSAPPKRVDSVLLRQRLSSREDGSSFLFGVMKHILVWSKSASRRCKVELQIRQVVHNFTNMNALPTSSVVPIVSASLSWCLFSLFCARRCADGFGW